MGSTTTHFNFPYPLPQDTVNVQLDIENLAQTVDTTLNTTFATKTYVDATIAAADTSDISEGSNLYYTAERVQDELDTSLIAGSGLTKTYDDTAGTYTLDIDSTVVTTTGIQSIESKTITNSNISGASNTISDIGLASQVTGTLPIVNGGTGQTTASNAINALVPSQSSNAGKYLQTDGSVVSWGTVFDINTTQTLSNKTFLSPKEEMSIVASAATGTINLDVKTAAILYYTSDATANWVLNIRGDSSTTLNSLMSTGQAITVAFMATQGTNSAYYQTQFRIDSTSVVPKWQGGLTPVSSIDIYTFTIVKTGNATFTVLGSQVKFS
jgi:hypothetical protein